jgi:Protein of unknown function (DUF3443)
MRFARTEAVRGVLISCLCLSLALAIGCGGGSNNSNNTVTPTQNTQPIAVNGGPQAAIALSGLYLNGAFTSVTVCVPGSATSCQTIDGVLVDTGSFGLRLLSSTSGGELTLALPTASISGSPLGECTQFADLSFIWGPVKTADIKIAGEQASSVPINIIGDTSFPAVPSSCSTGNQDDDTLAVLGANGILGVGTFQQDCGSFCSTGTAPTGFYYQCPASGCVPTLVGLTQQVQNPVGLFAADNNGVIVELPAVNSPQPSITGSMIFGIGTQADNALGSATVFPIDSSGGFTTTYNNVAYTGSFIDSGSNGLFFLDAATTGMPICTDTSFWYCPTSTTPFNVSNQATGGSPHALSFSVGNFDQLIAGANAAVNGTAGPNPSTFDFGLPFFYGRNVFTSIAGSTAPGGQTPYWAY